MVACLLFGFSTAMSIYLGNPTLGLNVNESLLSMIPYIVTLVNISIICKKF